MLYRRYIKRVVDVVLSALALLVLAPLFIVVAIAIKLDSRGPVFFTQLRAGQNGRPFRILKFRTMLTFEDSYYPDGTPMANYDRITRVGRFLRKTSIDELPQLINVLLGSMSLVGPRPALMYQVERYSPEQRRRLEVKPGLTGLAQVSGRNALTWGEKIAYDLQYIDRISFILDFCILVRTFFVVAKGTNIEFSRPDDISKHVRDIRLDVGDERTSIRSGSR